MSCLFNSLSAFHPMINGEIHDSYKIRQTICDFLQKDNPNDWDNFSPSQFIAFEGMTLNDYVLRMRSTSTWGGAIEISTFVKIYGINVIVVNIRDKDRREIQFIDAKNTRAIHITWSGGHYEPLL